MKSALLPLLACPQCRGDLTLAGAPDGDADILAGELRCAACARMSGSCLPSFKTPASLPGPCSVLRHLSMFAWVTFSHAPAASAAKTTTMNLIR